MTSSAQHQLAKYLSSLSNLFSLFIRATACGDSFTFADIIKISNLDPSSVFLCSFDISSLFTNVPPTETIQVCADALYSSKHPPAPFLRQIFVELMEMATSSLEFSLMTSCLAKSTESPCDHLLDQPLPIFLLATRNLNFFRPLRNRRCITAI